MAFVIASSGIMILLASCSKKNEPQPEPVGEAKVKYVNAVDGSLAQDFQVNGVKKNTAPVAYGNASEYFVITSGSNVFKFFDAGTATLKAESQPYSIPIAINASVFYLQAPGGQFGVVAIGDNMVAPAAGKAKVRFININKFAAVSSSISVTIVGETTPLIPTLTHLLDPNSLGSDYFSVDPGVKFKFAATGVTDAPELNAGIVAGKNYTIWIDGSSASNLTGHVILQN